MSRIIDPYPCFRRYRKCCSESFSNGYTLMSKNSSYVMTTSLDSGKQRNTVDALACVMEQIRASKDQQITSFCVFLDLKKAFDTIDHEILILKLENMGLRGHVSALVRSYLSDRHQFTQVNGSYSKLGLIRTGIPKGSVLGPILFLLYINDLTKSVQSHVTLFAGDTNIFDHMKQDGSNNLDNTLSIVNSCMKSNKLKCNLENWPLRGTLLFLL